MMLSVNHYAWRVNESCPDLTFDSVRVIRGGQYNDVIVVNEALHGVQHSEGEPLERGLAGYQ